MDCRYVKLLVASLVLLGCPYAEAINTGNSIEVEGQVISFDRQPFPGAVVTATEYKGRIFMMPAIRQQVRTTSSGDGRFNLTLSDVRGIIDVRANHAECVWDLSDVVTFYPEDWRGKEKLSITLISTRGNCEVKATVP